MSLIQLYKEILNPNQKILSVVHRDLDGLASAIVLKNVYKNLTIRSLKYGEVDEYMKTIDPKEYDLVIFSDISPESDDAFEKFHMKHFLLDHHGSAVRFNCPEKNRIVIEGKSAALLVKEFFENLFKIDLSYLNDFCNVVNDYDLWILNDHRSWALNELFFFYYDCDFVNRFKNGNMKFSKDEQEYILKRKKEFNEVYNKMAIYDFDRVNACFVIQKEFVNDICHKLMKDKGYLLTICVNPKSKSCSVRSNFEKLDCGKMLQELGIGGGHSRSSAFRIKEYEEVQEKIDMIEKYLYDNFKEFRK